MPTRSGKDSSHYTALRSRKKEFKSVSLRRKNGIINPLQGKKGKKPTLYEEINSIIKTSKFDV